MAHAVEAMEAAANTVEAAWRLRCESVEFRVVRDEAQALRDAEVRRRTG